MHLMLAGRMDLIEQNHPFSGQVRIEVNLQQDAWNVLSDLLERSISLVKLISGQCCCFMQAPLELFKVPD